MTNMVERVEPKLIPPQLLEETNDRSQISEPSALMTSHWVSIAQTLTYPAFSTSSCRSKEDSAEISAIDGGNSGFRYLKNDKASKTRRRFGKGLPYIMSS